MPPDFLTDNTEVYMETDYNNPGPTCQKIEDLIRWVRPIVRRWPRAERETLGADVMNQLHTMYRLATKARLHYYNKIGRAHV